MLDLAITWLPVIGAIVISLAIAIWYGQGNKTVAIWSGFFGAVLLAAGFSLHLQKIAWDSESPTVEARAPAGQRPWIGIDVEIAGPLTFGKYYGIPLKITMTNSSATPAAAALAHPMIFTNEKQPFSVQEIIKRRSQNLNTSGTGHSVFQSRPVVELNTPSNEISEFKGQIFILVAARYRSPNGKGIYLTANLFSLARKGKTGGAFAIEPEQGNVPAGELLLIPLGSHVD